ncbi:MAG: signal recognition particle-docking protein FtsY [Mycoplasmataceae bacterium]|nr:signal recognition particle-docking protein FtsY [Mycoplasmataceae bacterium]
MGIFQKFKHLFNRKPAVADQVAQKNLDHTFVEQTKFDDGLKLSANSLNSAVNQIAAKYYQLDDVTIERIEEALIMYDVGPNATKKILDAIVQEIKLQKVQDPQLIKQIIIDKLIIYYIQNTATSSELNLINGQLNVILITGVNGVGKTTTIAKLTSYLLKQNKRVCLVAADTFRAGAVAQLGIWAEKLNVPIFKPKTDGQDPASVVYEGVKYAQENHFDVVLCDTSGRLQTKVNLMNELKKINDIIKKFLPNQPIESLLVLDATSGQNGIFQAKAFNEVTKLTGVVLTKMDSTSKGGVILSIKDAFNLPIKFIGLGEGIDDLMPFDLELFIHGLTSELEIK